MRRLKGVTDGVVGVKSTPVPGVGAGVGACGLGLCRYLGWVGLLGACWEGGSGACLKGRGGKAGLTGDDDRLG